MRSRPNARRGDSFSVEPLTDDSQPAQHQHPSAMALRPGRQPPQTQMGPPRPRASADQECRSSKEWTKMFVVLFAVISCFTTAVVVTRTQSAARKAADFGKMDKCHLATYPDWQIGELKELNLSRCNLSVIPDDVALWSKLTSLKKLDLNGNSLTKLPLALEVLAPSLEILFLSDNEFGAIPDVIGRLVRLRLLSFKGNKLTELSTVNLPTSSLEWLILTNNQISRIDSNVRDLRRLRKLMLSHNAIENIPPNMGWSKDLELIRLADNRIAEAIPSDVLTLPKLAWISLSGNPISKAPQISDNVIHEDDVALDRSAVLGRGASGTVFGGKYMGKNVAVKMFKEQSRGSDGNAMDEAAINGLVSHPLAVSAIAVLRSEKNSSAYVGTVMNLLQGTHSLGKVPSFDSVTRDEGPARRAELLSKGQVFSVIWNVASVLSYVHNDLGLSHGDVYLHNILQDGEGVPRLSDWGASFVYDRENAAQSIFFQKIEVLAFGRLVQDLFEWHMKIAVPDSTEPPYRGKGRGKAMEEGPLYDLLKSILQVDQSNRPTFDDIKLKLSSLPEFEGAVKADFAVHS